MGVLLLRKSKVATYWLLTFGEVAGGTWPRGCSLTSLELTALRVKARVFPGRVTVAGRVAMLADRRRALVANIVNADSSVISWVADNFEYREWPGFWYFFILNQLKGAM